MCGADILAVVRDGWDTTRAVGDTSRFRCEEYHYYCTGISSWHSTVMSLTTSLDHTCSIAHDTKEACTEVSRVESLDVHLDLV